MADHLRKDRSASFCPAMVRTLLADTKTQTRRLAWRVRETWEVPPGAVADRSRGATVVRTRAPTLWQKVQPGDRLWVKEPWGPCDGGVCYRADEPPGSVAKPDGGRWQPGMFMPRWASRITLHVTAVRMEHLHAITPEDEAAEGVPPGRGCEGAADYRPRGTCCTASAPGKPTPRWSS